MGNVPLSALRQPPPPHRCLQIDSPAPTTGKAEGDASRVRSWSFYRRRCKTSMIESLPDELLIEILLRLSVDEIYEKARLVCRRWRHLTRSDVFVQTHLHRSSSGLLLKPLTLQSSSAILMTATSQGRVKISELSCRVKFPIVYSCNGLALCTRSKGSRWIPFLFNPATKCAFNLPKCLMGAKLLHRFGIAYAAASMAYKVVGSYLDSGGVEVVQCGILTVGVDNELRNVAVEGLSPEARLVLMNNYPLMTGGFMHWVSETLAVSLNVETETFTVTPTPALMFPPDYQETKYGYHRLSTGEYLSLFVSCGDWSWGVWEMKPETWEWRKVFPKLDLEAHKCKFQQFASRGNDGLVWPVGWVRYPEVLAFFFGTSPSCIIYNLVTEEIESIKLSTAAGYHLAVQHRNSLVWS